MNKKIEGYINKRNQFLFLKTGKDLNTIINQGDKIIFHSNELPYFKLIAQEMFESAKRQFKSLKIEKDANSEYGIKDIKKQIMYSLFEEANSRIKYIITELYKKKYKKNSVDFNRYEDKEGIGEIMLEFIENLTSNDIEITDVKMPKIIDLQKLSRRNFLNDPNDKKSVFSREKVAIVEDESGRKLMIRISTDNQIVTNYLNQSSEPKQNKEQSVFDRGVNYGGFVNTEIDKHLKIGEDFSITIDNKDRQTGREINNVKQKIRFGKIKSIIFFDNVCKDQIYKLKEFVLQDIKIKKSIEKVYNIKDLLNNENILNIYGKISPNNGKSNVTRVFLLDLIYKKVISQDKLKALINVINKVSTLSEYDYDDYSKLEEFNNKFSGVKQGICITNPGIYIKLKNKKTLRLTIYANDLPDNTEDIRAISMCVLFRNDELSNLDY